jgi:AP-4 complex subunit mu-1
MQIPADKAASGLEVEVPTPPYVQRVHCDVDSTGTSAQSWDYSEKTHLLK